MKVDLLDDISPAQRASCERNGQSPVALKRSLPFFISPLGSRVHRVRSATWYRPNYQPHHIALHLWCGQGGFLNVGRVFQRGCGHLHAEPPEGWPVCATCEGRAIGSGQIASEELTGHPLIFTPLPGAKIECVWERGRRGYAWTDYYKCRTRAKFIASKAGEEERPTCTYHRRQAIPKGWTVVPIDPPFSK